MQMCSARLLRDVFERWVSLDPFYGIMAAWWFTVGTLWSVYVPTAPGRPGAPCVAQAVSCAMSCTGYG